MLLTLAVAAIAQERPAAARVTLPGPANAIPPGPFAPTWDSIRANYRVPAWLQDAKFGIFILYATLFAWPADGKVTVTSLAEGTPGTTGRVEGVTLLGSPQPVKFTRDAAGLQVTLPPWKPSDLASVLRITGLKFPSPAS